MQCRIALQTERLTMEDLKLKYVYIDRQHACVDGVMLEHESQGGAMLSELYRAHIGDWPKFFKMDTLSKVGFLASDLLLKALGREKPGEEYTSDCAVVLFGATASLCADRNYQETIQDADNYYPSPALFVYTLPNIVTGEIAIRNRFRGETSFYVVEKADAAQMAFHLACAFDDDVTAGVLAGWVDSRHNDDFQAFFTMVTRDDAKDTDRLAAAIQTIMDNSNI